MRFSIVNFSIMMLCCWCTAPSDTSASETKFTTFTLNWHNYYRKKCGVPSLQLDDKISEFSTHWARTLAKNNELTHSHNPKYGENLYLGGFSGPASNIRGSIAVRSWYSEISYYTPADYKKEPSSDLMEEAGHYTQVVWKASRKLGVGLATTNTSSGMHFYVVCNYSPLGNFQGQYTKNVFPPK